MQNKNYTNSTDFLQAFFGEAEGVVELRHCPNERGSARAVSLFENDPVAQAQFCVERDQPGSAIYFGLCSRRPGTATGTKADVLQAPALWVDIDCAKQQIPGAVAIAALDFLPFPPSITVNSGGGLHAYWVLEEPADVSTPELYEPIERLCRQLALVLAGDTSCAEIARILRLPGTLNSKDSTCALNDGQPIECEVLSSTGHVYSVEQLAEWLAEQRPVLEGKAKPEYRAVQDADPFVAYAREAGFNPSIDIETELAAMEYEGGGDHSIHQTQLRVSMSMIARGYEDHEIVSTLLAATQAAAPRDAKWNWNREEKSILGMIRSGRQKVADRPRKPTQPMVAGNTALKLVHDVDAEPKADKKAVVDKTNEIAQAGEAVIGVWHDRYGPIAHANGTSWAYAAGVWQEWGEEHSQRLRSVVQDACASLKVKPSTGNLNAIFRYVMERPSLHRDRIAFDEKNIIVCADGCLDLDTFEVVAHSPEHYATIKVAAYLEGDRGIASLESFLSGCFADRPEAKAIIATLQEWFGASIVPLGRKQRAQKKGLLAHGPSRTGKTQLSELIRYLLGHRHVSGAKMRDLDDRFGVEPFIGKRGWIADDAVGEGEFLEAEIYKVVVTGEQTSTRRKGGKNWEGRFGIPVLLTANNLPRVRDQSDATYNRSLILPMTKVREEHEPEPAGYDSISAKIAAEELTGLLWWAIEGWKRLEARGTYAPPALMLDATKAFKDDNNPVGAWLNACVSLDASTKVARLDLVASFNGWRSLEHDDDRPWKNNTITRRIAQLLPQLGKTKLQGERMFTGLRLNEDGLYAWQRARDTAGFEKKITYSAEREDVNRYHDPSPQNAPAASTADAQHQSEIDRRPRF